MISLRKQPFHHARKAHWLGLLLLGLLLTPYHAHAQTRPANDSCTNAISVACGDTVSGSTLNATTIGSPSFFCGTSITAPGVWYQFSGNGDSVALDLCSGTNYDSKLYVFSGSCGALQCVNGNDDACSLQSRVEFTSLKDTTYYIYVSGFRSRTGNFQLAINCISQFGNDLDGEAAGDEFGWDVALSHSGDTMAVGAPLNDGTASNSGHVRVFAYDASNESWNQLGSDIDGEASGDLSGYSVSLSADGDRVAIGARWNDGGGTRSGHTRIYEYDASTDSWTQLGSDIDGEAAGDESGFSVSLSADGDRVAIGARFNDGGGTRSGHTRIYEYNTSTSSWTQLGSDIDGEAAFDESGYSVSLSADGNQVAIGGPVNDDGPGFNAGHTRIYEYNSSNSSWTQLGSDIDGGAADDQLGFSVSLSADGSRVAIGANQNDDGGSNAGQTQIYEYNASATGWTQLGNDIDGEAAGDISGRRVSLSADGGRVAIGAWGNDGNGSNAGHTRIFEYDTPSTSWNQVGSDIDGEASGDQSGLGVSLSAYGDRVAIGANYNDGNGSNAGHARVFEIGGGSSSCLNDTVPPAISSSDTLVYLDSNGAVRLNTDMVLQGASDNCFVDSIALSQDRFSCADLGANQVVMTAFDTSGNFLSDTATVTVVDTFAPVAIALDTTIALDANGQAALAAASLDDGSSDNCAVNSISITQGNFSCADLGANVIVMTVTDTSSNFSRVTATVTVIDTLAPTTIASDTTIALDANGQTFLAAASLDDGSRDNCAVNSLSLSQERFSCADLGSNQVVLTAFDSNGNFSRDTATVTVIDTNDYSFAAFATEIQDDTLMLVQAQDATLNRYVWRFTADDVDSVSGASAQYVFDTSGTYSIRLVAQNENACLDTSETTVSVTITMVDEASQYLQAEIFPNPTSGDATLRFQLAQPAQVRLSLHDLRGRTIQVVSEQQQSGGQNEIAVPTARLAEGLYLLRLQVDGLPYDFKLQKQ